MINEYHIYILFYLTYIYKPFLERCYSRVHVRARTRGIADPDLLRYLKTMVELDTRQAVSEIRKKFRQLTSNEIALGQARAINRSLTKGRTMSSRSIRKDYKAKAGDVKKRLDLQKASRVTLTGHIGADTKPMPMMLFRPSQRRDGVSVRITRTRKRLRGAFMATMPSGHRGVWARGRYTADGFKFMRARLPITELRTVSISSTIKNRDVESRIGKEIGEFFPQRMLHELRNIARRI